MDVNNLNNLNTNNNHYTNNNAIEGTSVTSHTSSQTSTSTNFSNVSTNKNGEDYATVENQKLKDKIEALIEEVNEDLKPVNKEISYALHDKVNRYIITIKDKDSGEVIKEVPAKEQVDIFAKILESSGLLFDELS